MTIKRVESLTYGADDPSAGIKFHEDLGLEKVESGANGATFRTPSNQYIHVRKSSDTGQSWPLRRLTPKEAFRLAARR